MISSIDRKSLESLDYVDLVLEKYEAEGRDPVVVARYFEQVGRLVDVTGKTVGQVLKSLPPIDPSKEVPGLTPACLPIGIPEDKEKREEQMHFFLVNACYARIVRLLSWKKARLKAGRGICNN